jgi:hypothetical protein
MMVKNTEKGKHYFISVKPSIHFCTLAKNSVASVIKNSTFFIHYFNKSAKTNPAFAPNPKGNAGFDFLPTLQG